MNEGRYMPNEPDLRRLLLDAKGDRSYRQFAADCGGLPTEKRIQQIANGTELKAFPDKESIEGIARGTGVTVTAVILAAARSLGLEVHSGDDPDAMILAGANTLRPDQKAALHALARSFQQSNEEQRRELVAATLTPYLRGVADSIQLSRALIDSGALLETVQASAGHVRDAMNGLERRRQTFDEFPGVRGMLADDDIEEIAEVERLIASYLADLNAYYGTTRREFALAADESSELPGATPPGQSEEGDL